MTYLSDLKKIADEILGHDIDALVERPELGELNFKQYRHTFENVNRLFTQVARLTMSSLEALPVDTLSAMVNASRGVNNALGNIRAFSIVSHDNASQVRNRLLNELVANYDTAFKTITPVLPVVSMLFGERDDSREEFMARLAEITNSASRIRTIEKDIENIREAARGAAVQVGVAHHATRFAQAAKEYDEESGIWLGRTVWFLVATLLIAILSILIQSQVLGSIEANMSFLVSKAALFILLLSATIWSGKNYRTLRHLKVVNEHRQHALETFEAFVKAAGSDVDTKNAVLLEATRAIFQSSGTGYLAHDDSSLPATKIIEIARNTIGRSEAR